MQGEREIIGQRDAGVALEVGGAFAAVAEIVGVPELRGDGFVRQARVSLAELQFVAARFEAVLDIADVEAAVLADGPAVATEQIPLEVGIGAASEVDVADPSAEVEP